MINTIEVEKRCPCGGVILADTEDWETPLCNECFESIGSPDREHRRALVLEVLDGITVALTAMLLGGRGHR